MTLWMAWATAVTALLGLAALLGERALRISGRQGRWAWAAAVAGALALQVWSLLRPPLSGSSGIGGAALSGDAFAGLPVLLVEGIEAAAISAPALLERLEPLALIGWLTASAVLLAGLLGGLWRLRREASRWTAGRVAGLEVLVSEDFGPALVGVWSPRIVVPRWAFSMTPEALKMACLHEAEHRAARDTWLLFGGALLVGLTPWNAALWWQIVRLRQAIEVDCDRRVLNTGVSRSSYGALLLELGAHPRGVGASVAALAQPPSLLERRLTMMMSDVKRGGPIRTAGILAASALLAFAACETPAPTAIQPPPDPEAAVVPATAFSQPRQMAGEVVADLLAQSSEPLINIDGVRIENALVAPSGGPTLWDMIDPTDIDRIEIIKGAAAEALFGGEAAGGVIQIFTKAGSDVVSEADAQQIHLKKLTFDSDPTEREASTAGMEDVEIYVDAVLFEGDITEIDKRLIESVEVVKAPAGDKIHITLKKREPGRSR